MKTNILNIIDFSSDSYKSLQHVCGIADDKTKVTCLFLNKNANEMHPKFETELKVIKLVNKAFKSKNVAYEIIITSRELKTKLPKLFHDKKFEYLYIAESALQLSELSVADLNHLTPDETQVIVLKNNPEEILN